MTQDEVACPHGEEPRHHCPTGEHLCMQCGCVSGHTSGCEGAREGMTKEERATFDAALEVVKERR